MKIKNTSISADICAVFSSDGGETFDTSSYTTLVYASDYGVKNVSSRWTAAMSRFSTLR